MKCFEKIICKSSNEKAENWTLIQNLSVESFEVASPATIQGLYCLGTI